VPVALVVALLCGDAAAYVLMSPRGAARTGRGVPLSEGLVSVNAQAPARNGRGSPAAAQSQDSSSRTIFYNGKVFTSVSAALWAEGVVVSGRHIVAVGTNDEVLAYRTADSVLYNLNGRVLVPGFNDAHVHPVRPITAYPRATRVNDARDFVPGSGPSTAEMLDLVANAAAATPPGTWIFGAIGAAVLNDSAADRFAIDARVSGHPVMLFAWTGHGAILNSIALATVGVSEQEPDPFGGFYERVDGTSIVNGVAHEYAVWRMFRYFFDRMTDKELIAAYQGASAAAASFGYTSIQEFPIGLDYDRSVRVLDAAGVRLRWRSVCFPLSVDENCRATASNPLVDSSGIKWIADGTPIERLAALNQAYADDPNSAGRFNFSEEVFSDIVALSESGPPRGQQFMLHIAGDRAVDLTLAALERAAPDSVWNSRRPRFEHGDLILPANFARLRNKGIIVVQNPTHFGIADVLNARWHPDLLRNAMPQRSLLEAGIGYAIGSDANGTGLPGLDLFLALIHPVRPSEAISLEDALIAYTSGGARAEFRDHVKGRLAPGQLADLAVLSQDITAVPVFALPGTVSLLTMVDGRVVYDRGVLSSQ
jgi:predicted amidohydrolase YtcJ